MTCLPFPKYASPLIASFIINSFQYEVIFSDSFISDIEAKLIIEQASSAVHDAPPANTKGIESRQSQTAAHDPPHPEFDPLLQTYEIMYLHGEKHLCTIPIVDVPPRNETSEAEARAAEQKELARATDRGWELLKDLEGNCLYFVSGWWSYSFCYNSEITQFHQLPSQPGKPPQRDSTTKAFVLGRAKGHESKEDEWGNQITVHKGKTHKEPPKTELQVKGDTRYLVQQMEGGTTCDLTGKPRKVEVQYHCNPHVTDRIGYIKEVTTCSYLMVVYTPRLCNDVAFMPPKENKANSIICREVVDEDEIAFRTEIRTLEAELDATAPKEKLANVGGLLVGAGKWANKEGQRLPIPANFGQENQGKTVELIAKGTSKAEGGQVEMISDAELQKLDLDPEMVDEFKKKLEQLAAEKGWRIQAVNQPGHTIEILGIVEDGEEGERGEDEEDGGSEEIFFKDEL
jgi:protein OS-9